MAEIEKSGVKDFEVTEQQQKMIDFIAKTANIEGIRKLKAGDFRSYKPPGNKAMVHKSKTETGTVLLNANYVEPFYKMCKNDRELGLAIGFTFWHPWHLDRKAAALKLPCEPGVPFLLGRGSPAVDYEYARHATYNLSN